MRVVAIGLLAAACAGAVDVHVGFCRTSPAITGGRANWADDGRGGIVGMSDGTGRIELIATCKVKLPRQTARVTVDVGRVRVSFGASKDNGSGVVLESGDWKLEALRVTGESWIEVGNHVYDVKLPAPSRQFVIRLKLIDASTSDPLRVDIGHVKVMAAE